MKKWLVAVLALLLVLCCGAALASGEIKFDTNAYTVFEGETVQLEPQLAVEGDITYSTNAAKIATVDENGLVTALSKGSATITAAVKTEAGKTYKASVKVTVQRAVTSIEVNTAKLKVYAADDPALDGLLTLETANTEEVPAEGNEDAEPSEELPVMVFSVGTSVTFTATLLPKDATNRKFVVTSDDEEEAVVKINSYGTGLKPVAPGECVITFASVTNPEVNVSYHVLVTQPVKSLKLTTDTKTIEVGATTEITPNFTPDNVTITAVTWTSNNEKVATVDAHGVVTGVGRGTASITAKATDGSNQKGSITITVQQQPTGITLTPESPTIAVGSTRTMKAEVLPKNADNKAVTWTSSDESIATVNQRGVITPKLPGECTITCTSQAHPEISAETVVSVIQPAKSIRFNESQTSVIVGESVYVDHTIEPSYTTDQSVTYSSNNTKVATVDPNTGYIYGVKAGTATITVTTADGSKKRSTIKVTVIQPVEGVHMKSDSANVGVDERITLTAVLEPSDASNTYMTWEVDDPTIATVSGNRTRPVVTGKAWGDVVVTGTTEDGGYTTSCYVKVGNYNKALEIIDLYVDSNNDIRLSVDNVSDMNMVRFYVTFEVYDLYGNALSCTKTGSSVFDATYAETLYAGETTRHNRFSFYNYTGAEDVIGKVVAYITTYTTDEGFTHNIKDENLERVEYTSVYYNPGGEVEPSAE